MNGSKMLKRKRAVIDEISDELKGTNPEKEQKHEEVEQLQQVVEEDVNPTQFLDQEGSEADEDSNDSFIEDSDGDGTGRNEAAEARALGQKLGFLDQDP